MKMFKIFHQIIEEFEANIKQYETSEKESLKTYEPVEYRIRKLQVSIDRLYYSFFSELF